MTRWSVIGDTCWFRRCRSEREARRLHRILRDADLLVVQSGRDLGGVADERDRARELVAENTPGMLARVRDWVRRGVVSTT